MRKQPVGAFQDAADGSGGADVQVVDVSNAFAEGVAIEIAASGVAAALVNGFGLIGGSGRKGGDFGFAAGVEQGS